MDGLEDSIALKDAAGRFLVVNQVFADQVGLPKAEIEGRFREEFLPVSEMAVVADHNHQEVVRTGKTVETEATADHGDGPRIFLGRHTPILDAEGRVELVASISSDITERRRAEDALRQSETNLRALIENMDAIVALKDADGAYVIVNEKFAETAEKPQEEIIGKTARELYGEQRQISLVESQDSEVLGSGALLRFERTLPDGRTTQNHKAPVLADDGSVTGIVSVEFDITQLRAAQEELRKVHEYYRLIVDTLQETVALKDASGRFLLVNQAFVDQVGFPRERIEDKTWEDFVTDPDLSAAARQRLEDVLATGEGAEFETTAEMGDGLRTYHRRDTPILDSQGRVDRIVSVSNDITERKRAEEALRQSEVNYRTLIENMDANSGLKGVDGKFVVVNKRLANAVGMTPEEVVGKTARDLYDDPEVVAEVEAEDTKMIKSRNPITFERLGQDNRVARIHKTPVIDGDGNVTGIVTVVWDVTDLRAAEDELRRTREMYRLLVDNLEELVVLKDASGRFQLVNQAFADRAGLTKEEIEGTTREEFFADPELAKLAKRRHDEIVRTGESAEFETESDHDSRIYYGRETPILDSEGRVDSVVSISTDITARRRAEDALMQSEANYRTLIENMDASISLKDAGGRFIVVNEGFARTAGRSREEIIGKTTAEVYDQPGTVSNVESEDKQVVESRKPLSFERKRVGGDRIYYTQKAPVLDEAGNATGIVSVAIDVTQQRETEAELRRTHELWRLVVDSLQETVVLKDTSSRFLLVNQAFADHIGLPKGEIEGKYREEFLPASENTGAAGQEDAEVVKTGRSLESESSADRGDGKRTFYGRHTPILDSEGQVERIVSIFMDVTERKRLESELRQSQKMQVVGQLAGGIAHDFNNLLTAIAAYAAMAERELPLDHGVAPFQRGILDAVDRASALVRQLLLFSKRDMANLEVVDVNDLIVGSADMLRRLIGANIDLVSVPYRSPLLIEVDPSQLEQVLVNLAVNARDAMPAGGKLTVAADRFAVEGFADDHILLPGSYAKLSVSDDGTGMTVEVRDRVFEPFFTTKDTGEGSGLGLSTCFGIVKENGGDIRVTTAPGAGTTFDVYVPITSKPAPPPDKVPDKNESPAGKETILLAEDEAVVRDLAAVALREQGYTVVEASNGEEALRAAEAHDGEIHMLLTDMVMPRMGGRELSDRLRERWPGIPVLLMSGYTGEERMSETTPLLNKPFVIGELLVMVRQTLDQSGPGASDPKQQLGLWPAAEQ